MLPLAEGPLVSPPSRKVHTPAWQTWTTPQSTQVRPPSPQVAVVICWQVPVASQHPVQEEGPQGDLQAATARPMTATPTHLHLDHSMRRLPCCGRAALHAEPIPPAQGVGCSANGQLA